MRMPGLFPIDWDPQEYAELARRIRPGFLARLRQERLSEVPGDSLCQVYLSLAEWVHRQKQPGKPFVLGVNGAQGSGKSTLRTFLELILQEGYGYRVAGLSIDDIYKTRAERQQMGREIHPLFATRGVPGTHDVDLGMRTLRALVSSDGGAFAIPAFDKATDDRRPPADWPVFEGPADVAIFEGWCVGARPQAACDLFEPVNELERREDKFGVWRGFVNQQLQGPYARLFAQIDRLIFIKAPGMDSVIKWRSRQEQTLAETTAATGGKTRLMDARALQRFVMHFERLTRHMLEEMPDRADLTLCLNDNHQFIPLIEQP